MVKLHKSGEIKFLHKNLSGNLLICTKKPQENRTGIRASLKKLDNSSRCTKKRQRKGAEGVEKYISTVKIMVKVPVSAGKMRDSPRKHRRKRPFHWWISPIFALEGQKKWWETALGFPPNCAFGEFCGKSASVSRGLR